MTAGTSVPVLPSEEITMTEAKKTTTKKPAAKKEAVATESKASSLVVMVHDDGRKANVHPSMVDAYKSGGYREV